MFSKYVRNEMVSVEQPLKWEKPKPEFSGYVIFAWIHIFNGLIFEKEIHADDFLKSFKQKTLNDEVI